MKRFFQTLTVALVAMASLVLVAPEATAAAPPVKPCLATVSASRPAQYSTVTVTVSRVPAAVTVTTIAKYKTTSTKKTAKATSAGKAIVKYSIGRATAGYKVVVSVTAQKGTQKYACSTSFTPHTR